MTMPVMRAVLAALVLLFLGLARATTFAHSLDEPHAALPMIGPAPGFALTDQDGKAFSLSSVRGRVVAINFIYTRCTDVCPIDTDKMVGIQHKLGARFGHDVYFISVTVDPDHDTPGILADYAKAFGCDLSGWTFLTGSVRDVREVAREYGVLVKKVQEGDVAHNLLTTLIDREGTIRVQYMGEQFDPDEMLQDLLGLVSQADTQ